MKKLLLLIVAVCTSFFVKSQSNDPFKQMMDYVGITEENLGFEPKNYWLRYPQPDEIQFTIKPFNDLMAEPQFIYDYYDAMAIAAMDYSHPKYTKNNHDALMRILFYEGIMHQSSQFRAYTASLWAEIDEDQPMLEAIKYLYSKTSYDFTYNRMGEKGEFPLNEKDLKQQLKNLDINVQKEVARAIINLVSAYEYTQLAMRNVDYKDAVNCWRIRHLGETQFDGMEFYPQMADVAKNIDMNSMYYAGIKLPAIAEQLADTLLGLKNSKLRIDWKSQKFDWQTPIGRIIITSTGDDIHNYSDAFLVIDLGGNDQYFGSIGANPSLSVPVSLAIDLSGDDKYINDQEFTHTQGAGLFGVGMLLDVSGDDYYKSKRLSQGASMFGVGYLADLDGDDSYEMWTSGQGGAYFGVGLAYDKFGDDTYKIYGDGQGYGGLAGVGSLINCKGDDFYYAEKDTAIIFRSDFWHSEKGQYNYSYVQGCGVGRRGDVTDGHDWAGGMGTLIDLEGDDKYEAGGWSQGCGYWYGMGVLIDKNGNDEYQSTHWSQAAGAHFAIGCLFDEGGNDKHINWGKLAAGIGFGHDYVIAIFYNKGGDDLYKVHNDGFGYAINKSQVFFIDTEGNDTYISGKGHQYGWNNFESQNPPGVASLYHLYSDQICFFADLNGEDKYLVEDFETSTQTNDERMKNSFDILIPNKEEKDKLDSKRYFGIGVDFKEQNGEIEYFKSKLKAKF